MGQKSSVKKDNCVLYVFVIISHEGINDNISEQIIVILKYPKINMILIYFINFSFLFDLYIYDN